MRKLMWLSIGFSLGCGLCTYILPQNWIIPLLLIGFLATLAGIPFEKIRRLSLCCLGLSLSLIWCIGFRGFYLQPAMEADGETVAVTVTATDYSYETDYGSAFDGKVELEGKQFRIRVYLNEAVELAPGDSVTGSFRLRYTPGGKESATYHPGKGIFLLGYQRGETVIRAGESDTFYPSHLAKMIKDILRRVFPGDMFAFAQALLLGDGTELDYATDTAFKISGIRHIIAVSGLHVTILYSLLSTIAFRNRYATALLTLPVLGLFAAVAGFTPSVTRSCIMVALMILAQLFNKEYDPPTALSFSVLAMLIVNPMVITSVSLQLSVGCVAGIQLVGEPFGAWLKARLGSTKGKGILPALKRWLASSVSITVGAMCLTTPLSAFYFGSVSLIGIVTNLVTLWVVNLIFNGLVVICLVSLVSLKAAGVMAGILVWPIRLVLGMSKALAAFPLAAVYTKSPYISAWIIFVYALLAAFLCGYKRRPKMLAGCAVVGLCVALIASWVEPLRDDVRVTVMDVGQGQSILLQSRGNTYLVDCGGDNDEEAADTVAETLLSQGISRLDGIIVTHCDRDHAGGLPALLTRIQADVVFYPCTEVPQFEVPNAYPVSRDLRLAFGDGEIRIFGPIYVSDANENSLCVLFTYGNYDILITGDRGSFGEQMLLANVQLPKVELLIAGHHGSKHSTTEALLEAVRPDYIFVSAGADNSFGHPSREMLDRAERYGCQVYRTDIHGTLIFRR